MKPRVNIETTFIGYVASKSSRDLVTAAHQQIAHEWWETRLADFEVCISQFVLDEAGAGDAGAAARRLDYDLKTIFERARRHQKQSKRETVPFANAAMFGRGEIVQVRSVSSSAKGV
jgi:hypothetical protein